MSEDIHSLSRPELMKIAGALGINFDMKWTKEEFANAISRRQKHASVVEIAEEGSEIPEGHVRIKIISNDESRVPIRVSVNNYPAFVPKDVEVNVPVPLLEVLQNTSRPRTRKTRNPESPGGFDQKVVDVPLYNVQVLGWGKSGVAKDKGGKPKIKPVMSEEQYSVRKLFRKYNGRWPKHAEEKEFQREIMQKKMKNISIEDVESEAENPAA